jgi:hypothetical protein
LAPQQVVVARNAEKFVITYQSVELSIEKFGLGYIESNWLKTETLERVFACHKRN